MTDYEIIEKSPLIKSNPNPDPKIKELDLSIHSSLEKSEKLEKSYKSGLSEPFENSESFEKSQEEDLLKQKEFFKDLKDGVSQELFLKVFKKHYFMTLFGIFSCYHVVISLISYFKDKS